MTGKTGVMVMTKMKRVRCWGCLWLVLGGYVHADAPAFDRPGIAFSPATLGAGTFTWEQGLPDVSHDNSSGMHSTLYSADTLLRAGLASNLEIQLGAALFNRIDTQTPAGHEHTNGTGDSSLALKVRVPATAQNFSSAVLARVSFATGDDAFSAGDRQYGLGTALAWSLSEAMSAGLYLNATHLSGQNSYTVSPNFNVALTATVGAYIEAATTQTTHAGSSHVAGAGVSWMATPATQLDLSADWGLASQRGNYQVGFGVSEFFN